MKAQVDILSPLPPSTSGIADYAAELLPYLREYWDTRSVVANEDELHGPSGAAMAYRTWLSARKRPVRLIHVGNNVFHEFCYHEARKGGAIVVLHDFNLHHLLTATTLSHGRDDWAAYADIVAEDWGEVAAKRIARLRRRGAFSELQEFLMPVNSGVLSRSEGVIVHSAWAKEEIAHRFPNVPVFHIPHHYSVEAGAQNLSRAAAKAHFGIDTGKLVISAIGYLTMPKQVQLMLRAVSLLRDRLPPFHVLLAGHAPQPEWLNAQIEASGLSRDVTVTGYIPMSSFQTAVVSSDVISNLRYPTAGESSGVLIRAMGHGRACLVFRYGAFLDYPEDCVAAAPLETVDPRPVADVLLTLVEQPDRRAQIERNAAAFIQARHNIAACAALYAAAIDEIMALRSRRGRDGY